MNINLTYGMAVNIREVQTKIQEKIDRNNEKMKMSERIDGPSGAEPGTGAPLRQGPLAVGNEESENIPSAINDPQPSLLAPTLARGGTRIAEADDPAKDGNQSRAHVGSHDSVDEIQGAPGEGGKTGYKFYNYAGTPIKFCVTDDDLNEDLITGLQR